MGAPLSSPSSPSESDNRNDNDNLDAHALHLRKVSEQLLSNPRTRQGPDSIEQKSIEFQLEK